jgi:predicted TIM-barrel fold metal-dependent hydrolase
MVRQMSNRRKTLANIPEHVPEKPRYPAIDAHNHLFGDVPPEELASILEDVGVKIFNNVTGNVRLVFDGRGYRIERRDLEHYLSNYSKSYPNRFAAFTMSDFAKWDDFHLFHSTEKHDGSADRFVDRCIQHLEEDIEAGACGLKVTKELGLAFQDDRDAIIPVDDPRLYPIWKRAGEMDIPVLIHASDPVGFFLPVDEENEHFDNLQVFPGWSHYGSFFSKSELLEQRDRMMADHPKTRFICPHVANHAEDLEEVSRFLDAHPNAAIDFSARIDELGRQPYTAGDFMVRYQDRILFGVDMPVSRDVYRCYYRFLETRDEYFEYPDYLGRWDRSRWRIYGLGLPDDVLRKIYFENAIRIIPTIEGGS